MKCYAVVQKTCRDVSSIAGKRSAGRTSGLYRRNFSWRASYLSRPSNGPGRWCIALLYMNLSNRDRCLIGCPSKSNHAVVSNNRSITSYVTVTFPLGVMAVDACRSLLSDNFVRARKLSCKILRQRRSCELAAPLFCIIDLRLLISRIGQSSCFPLG